MRKRNNSGFTLVEIALAILVVAIGVLAVFALLSAGLTSSTKAISDTNAAMFADTVFNGLRAVTTALAEEQNQIDGTKNNASVPNSPECPWENFWYKFKRGNEHIYVASGDVWLNTGPTPIEISSGTPSAIGFENVSQRGSGVTGLDNHALTYQIVVEMVPDETTLWDSTAQVTLKVWEGEFVDTTDAEPLVFYAEFVNPGDL